MKARSKFNLAERIRPELAALEGYASLEAPESIAKRVGLPEDALIKLDGNENPYGCSPRVREALARYDGFHIYPDATHWELRQALEGYVGVDARHILVGNGSDELIDLLLHLFISPGDQVIVCEPTFGMYRFSTEVAGGSLVKVSRDEAFEVDVAAVRAAISPTTKLLFLASPNNPTGNVTPWSQIETLLETGLVVVVDEAYHEFCGATAAQLVPEFDNLVVLRTFSKWAGLAGLRVGYGVFPAEMARRLFRIMPPYNVSSAGQIAARESLADAAYLRRTVDTLIAERDRLLEKLSSLGYLRVYPSQANFLLCRVQRGDARALRGFLESKGILVRYFDSPGLRDCIRISVGKPEHTDALVDALRSWSEAKDG